MASIWNYGVDYSVDPSGNTPLANYYFVHPVLGSDANTGGPSDPWATIAHAETNTSNGNRIVLGNWYYNIGGTTIERREYIGNQKEGVVFYGSGLDLNFSQNTELVNITVVDTVLKPGNTPAVFGCILRNCSYEGTDVSGNLGAFRENICIDSNINNRRRWNGQVVGNMFINTPVYIVHDNTGAVVEKTITDNTFDANSLLTIDWRNPASVDQVRLLRNNLNGGFIEVTTPVYQEDNGSVILNLQGSKNRYQYLASLTSGAIGYNTENSGNVRTGITLKSDTPGYGTGAAVNTGVSFGGNQEIVLNSSSETIQTSKLTADQKRTGSTIATTGIQDKIICDLDLGMIVPNPHIFEMRYSPTVGGPFSSWKRFQFDLPLLQDTSGRTTAELNYDPSTDQTEIEYFDYELKFVYSSQGVAGDLFGHQIIFKENFRVQLKDDSNDPIPNVTVSITNGDYVFNGVTNVNGYYDFLIPITVSDSLDIDVTYTPLPASGFPSGAASTTHSGVEGDLFSLQIELQGVGDPEFNCEIQTFNENGNSLNKALSNNENTVVKAIFTNINNEAVDPNLWRCIIRQWASLGSTDEGVIETLESNIVTSANDPQYQIIYQITLTPQQVSEIGDRITARLIKL